MASNKVIAGKYEGSSLVLLGEWAWANIGKEYVDHWELLDQSSEKSMSSALMRGAAGAALLGPIGLAAAVTAKNKNTYLVAVYYKTGEKSLLEMDERVYNMFLKEMF